MNDFAPLESSILAAGLLAPLDCTSDADARTWIDCDLASLVENRFFHRLDPRALDEAARVTWLPRATTAEEKLTDPRRQTWLRRPYWLMEEGDRVGTVALHPGAMEDGFLGVSSLYLFEERRGRGVATRALFRMDDVAREEGLHGLRIATHWAWQKAARFYLFRLQCWVQAFQRSLIFVRRRDLAAPIMHFGGARAAFELGATRLIDAEGKRERERERKRERERERLRWVESVEMKRLAHAYPERAREARQTFSLGLALHGFPLLRSAVHYRDRHLHPDGPESLAHRIRVFEAYDAKCGFELRTVKIPGLRYAQRLAK